MRPSCTVGELNVSMEVCFTSRCLATTEISQNMLQYIFFLSVFIKNKDREKKKYIVTCSG
jgi:hypothetical protein